jgi:hypothetical protein
MAYHSRIQDQWNPNKTFTKDLLTFLSYLGTVHDIMSVNITVGNSEQLSLRALRSPGS